MENVLKYTIFKTKWGYFGLAGTEYALYRTCLPGQSPEKLKLLLLKGLSLTNRVSSIEHRVSLVRRSFSEGGRIEFDKAFFKEIQRQIIAYFEGSYVNFSPDIPLVLNGFSSFYTLALTSCRYVTYGETITYVELARKSGRPAAARAAGNALAKNPLPLIIPCHRVIRSDGSLGGFSAPGGQGDQAEGLDEIKPAFGGLSLKRKLLAHEQNCLSATPQFASEDTRSQLYFI